MASFTDKSLQFNPYIQELPVEAMVQVGMQKQAQYDQGVQKIQNEIDRVGGIELYRPQDKQILQSKLNELGSRLKTVAAGDFSNQQLVNSVAGMTGQIIKDENIINAVSSTQQYKKAIKEREEYLKDGKTSPSNDWLFQQKTNKWMNGDVKETFSGGYDPYTNWRKNALDVIKGLTKDSTITDDAFAVDAKGDLVITDAIVRKKMSGISPEKIQEALLQTLTPADFKQMQTDSLYDYAGQDGVQFRGTIEKTFGNKNSFYEDQKVILENAKTTTTSAVEKKKLDSQIGDLNKIIKNNLIQKNSLIEKLNAGDIDGAKANFGTSNALGGIARAFSFTETSQTYETSPFAQAQQFKETKEQDWKKFIMGYNQEEKWKTLGYQTELEKIAVSKDANALKRKELEGYGGLPSTIDQADLPKYTLGRVVADVETGTKELNTAKKTFLKQQGKDDVWFAQQQAAWEKNPKGVDATVANFFNTTAAKQRQIDSDKLMIAQINKEAVAEYGDIGALIPKNSPNIIYRSGNEAYEYSPRDFVELNQMRGAYQSSYSGAGGASAVTYDKVKAKEEMSPKQYHLWEVANGLAPKNSANKVLTDNLNFYNKNVNSKYKDTLAQVTAYTAKEVTKRLTTSQGLEYTIPTSTPAQKSSIASVLTSFANLAESQKGGLANSPDFNPNTARTIALDAEAKYNIKVSEGTAIQPAMYEVTATGNKGNVVKFKMTPEQKRSVFGDQFDASPAVQMVRPYQEQIRKMGGYSTATSPGTSNHTNAFLNKIDFPEMDAYGVKANIVEPTPGKYSIRLSIFDPITQEWNDDIPFPRNELISEDKIAGALMGMNDAVAFELLYDKPATANDLNKVKKATKKPL